MGFFFKHGQVLLFLYVFYWNNEYIFGNTSRIWVQRVKKKLKLLTTYGEFDLLKQTLNFNGYFELGWRHQKSHVTLIYKSALIFFERYYAVLHSCKVS